MKQIKKRNFLRDRIQSKQTSSEIKLERNLCTPKHFIAKRMAAEGKTQEGKDKGEELCFSYSFK